MKTKTITLTQIGILVAGEVHIDQWDGARVPAMIDPLFIPNELITPKNILRAVNPGGEPFTDIVEALVDIYIVWDTGDTDYDRTLKHFNKSQRMHFNQVESLREEIRNLKPQN